MSAPTHDRAEAAIVESAGVLGGKPRFEGHRISVVDIVELLESDHSIDRTAAQLRIDVEGFTRRLNTIDSTETRSTISSPVDGPSMRTYATPEWPKLCD